MSALVIFTDLDGTLLDLRDYSFDHAVQALSLIEKKGIPLVICSSKTRTEIELYRIKLHNHHPFVSENGGGIFIPREYFISDLGDTGFQVEEEDRYHTIRLGARHADLRRALEEIRKEGFAVKGFGDMSAKEISDLTGLNIQEAEMSRQRDFDEPFVFGGGEQELPLLFRAIEEKGFHHTQGQFFHILGDSDKGKAVSILTDLFRKERKDIITIAIGDSPNDIPMLEHVDHPVIVQKSNGAHDDRIKLPRLTRAAGIGPEGWNRAVIGLIETLSP